MAQQYPNNPMAQQYPNNLMAGGGGAVTDPNQIANIGTGNTSVTYPGADPTVGVGPTLGIDPGVGDMGAGAGPTSGIDPVMGANTSAGLGPSADSMGPDVGSSAGSMGPGPSVGMDDGQNLQNPSSSLSSMSGGDIYDSDEEGENDPTGDWQTCQPGEDDGLFSKIKCYVNKKYTKYSALSKSKFSKTKSAGILRRLSNFIQSYLSKFSIIKTIVTSFLLYIIALALISMHTPNKIDAITDAEVIFVNRCIYAWLYILIFFCVIGLFYHFV
jgi:hypothetical protein